MKRYLACLIKILLLLIGYYAIQFVVMAAFAMIGGLNASGDIQAAMQSYISGRAAMVSLVSDALATALLILGYSFSKRSFAADMRLAPVKILSLWPVILGGVAAALIAGCAVRLLPQFAGAASESASGESIVVRVLATAIAAPIAQEFIFRGCIYGALDRCSKRSAALILSSVLYGMMHSSPVWMVIAFLTGLAFAYAANAYGSIKAAIAFHIAFCLAGMALFDGLNALETWAAGLICIFACAALAFCLGRIRSISRINAENGGNDVSGN